MDNKVVVIGGGGHAKVVISVTRLCGYQPVAVLDDSEALGARTYWACLSAGQSVLPIRSPIIGELLALAGMTSARVSRACKTALADGGASDGVGRCFSGTRGRNC